MSLPVEVLQAQLAVAKQAFEQIVHLPKVFVSAHDAANWAVDFARAALESIDLLEKKEC